MTKKETYKLKTSISEDLNLKNVFVDSAENWYLDPGDLFSTPRLDPVTLRSGQRGISPHWINTISRRNEMRRKRNIHQVILYCPLPRFSELKILKTYWVQWGELICKSCELIYYLCLPAALQNFMICTIHACTKDQIFLCHLKFTLLVSQTSTPGDFFSFNVLFTHFKSCDNIILLENWCFFQLSSYLRAYLYACMYCMHLPKEHLQTVRLEIVLRLEIGKQNMQAQDFCCRNHFGHHGR